MISRCSMLVLVLLLAARAQGVRADAVDAQELARSEAFASDAFSAYERGDYEAAVTLYRKALNAAHSANTLYNLARIYDLKLNDRALAIEYYVRYTQDNGADPERVVVANERLARLRALDQAERAPLRADPIPSATEARTSPVVQPPPEASRPAAPPAPRGGGITTWQVVGIVTGTVGVIGLGVGAGFGLAAKSDADVADAACDGNMCSTQEGVDAADDGRTKAGISTVAFIAGGALTALGVTLLLAGGESDGERPPIAGVYLEPNAVGTYVTGRW